MFRQLAAVIFAIPLLVMAENRATSQDLNALTPDQVAHAMQDRVLRDKAGAQSAGRQRPTMQPDTILPAPIPTSHEMQSSQLEQNMSARAGSTLQQFGYSQVGVGSNVNVPQNGAVEDNYILGPGDELNVILRGQENSEYSVRVDRNGQVVLPRLQPLLAAGTTLGDFRRRLATNIHRAYIASEASVSVGELRQVVVTVTGSVVNPGRRVLTGLSGPLDAILLSGGVQKSGSLRRIKLIRDGHVIPVDLYSLLTGNGVASFPNLKDGDRIFVPPIGPTVGVAGYIRRPRIYELPDGTEIISAKDLLALGNGPSMRGAYTVSAERIMPDGKMKYVDITGQPAAALQDGEVMILRASVNVSLDRLELVGAIRTPGAFALSKYPTLHDLLPSTDALLPGAYVLFAFIERTDPGTVQRTAIPFSPLQVIQGRGNLPLISNDRVHILTRGGMFGLLGITENQGPRRSDRSRRDAGSSGAGDDNSNSAVTRGSRSARMSNMSERSSALAYATDAENGIRSPANTTGEGFVSPRVDTLLATGDHFSAKTTGSSDAQSDQGATQLAALPVQVSEAGPISAAAAGNGISDLDGYSPSDHVFFGNLLSDNRVRIAGAVHNPGTYLVATNTTLAEAVIAAGGLSGDVDLKSFEFTSTRINNKDSTSVTARYNYPVDTAMLSHIVLEPYDRVEFHHVFSDRDQGSVTIEGEVRYPGSYNILRNEHLLSVLKRAGELTDVAYPQGALFLRASVAEREREEARKNIADLNSQLLTATVRSTDLGTPSVSADTVAAVQALLRQIETEPALGRISMIVDPGALARNPRLDPLLQPGDRIVIPKRPTSILLVGEVLRPGATQFDGTLSVRDYIRRAGGFTQFADTSRVIVVLPNGDAHVTESSWFFGLSEKIPAGSTIFVPRDLTGLSINKLLVDTIQIFSQLATGAAALAILSR